MLTMVPAWLLWTFATIVLVALVLDFLVLRKQGAHAVSVREAAIWSAVWVGVSLAFNGLLWWGYSQDQGQVVAQTKAIEFLTGYLIEKSLAIDNIFVFLMIFTHFAVPEAHQKRALMIGIMGAIVLRTLMILAGGWLLASFHWILYVFGAFLLITGVQMWRGGDAPASLQDNTAYKLLSRLVPVTRHLDGERFWTHHQGRRMATPLLLVVMLVGVTDVIFAVDSIPAIYAITNDAFIVLTSNILAILGLRAMYFLLAAMAARFHLLSYGLAVVLVFIGTKMMLVDVVKIPVLVSLAVVIGILAVTMVWSVRTAPRITRHPPVSTADGATPG